MDTPAKTRTVTLTGRRPVTIIDAEWPVIASASWSHECGQYGQNGHASATLRVRQHADGRALVNLVTNMVCQCNYEERSGGALLPSGRMLETAIRDVAKVLRQDMIDEQEIENLAQECCADLPAERI